MERAQSAYSRIHDHYAGLIRDGSIEVGQQLPTEAEIAREFRVSRATVQFAMSRLAWEGWIERFPGKGTFAKTRRLLRAVDGGRAGVAEAEEGVEAKAARGADCRFALRHFGEVEIPNGAKEAWASPNLEPRIVPGRVQDSPDAFGFSPPIAMSRVCIVDDKLVGEETHYFAPNLVPDFEFADITSKHAHELLVEKYLGLGVNRLEATVRVLDKADAPGILGREAELVAGAERRFSEEGRLIVYSEYTGYGPLETWRLTGSAAGNSPSVFVKTIEYRSV